MTVAVVHRSRVLAALAVALPIPLVAAAGLSLPLPGTVTRLAARLVPFESSAAAETGRDGSIVSAPGERRVTVSASRASTSPVARGVRHRPGPLAAATSVSRQARGGAGGPQAVTPVQTAAPKAEAATPTSSTSSMPDPAPAPAPAPTPVTTAPSPPPPTTTPATTTPTPTTPTPAQQVVGTVTTTASNAVASATNTVTSATNGVLGGAHP